MGQAERLMKTICYKQVIFALLPLFILITLSLAFHHHDVPLKLVSCAICKAKTTNFSAQAKPNIDWGFTDISKSSPLAVYVISYGLVIILSVYPFHPVFIFAFSNRSPPV
jgi:hypothetical protein